MTNSKSTKRALVSSVLAILVCVAMLIGTTFAWFTDTASTSVNTIQAGKLDVELQVATQYEVFTKEDGSLGLRNFDGWEDASNYRLNFVKPQGHEDEAILWEPGCTYVLPPLRVLNKGDLALKFKVVITGIQGDAKLNEVIDWTIGDVAQGTEQHLAAGANSEFTISGHMDEAAGNEYQGLSINGIAITVVATQAQHEYDSTGNTYDKDATFPSVWDGTTEELDTSADEIHITNAAQAAWMMNVTSKGDTNSWMYNKTFVLDCDLDFNGQTISGFGGLDDNIAFKFDGNGKTISNFVINALDDAHQYNDEGENVHLYAGLFQQLNGTVKNLTVKGATVIGDQMVGVIASNGDSATIENCKVYDSKVIGGKKVGAVVGYVSSATVKDCYAENCEVYAADTRVNQSAELVGYIGSSTVSNKTPVNVTVTRGVVTPTVANGETVTDVFGVNFAYNATNEATVIVGYGATVENWTDAWIGSDTTIKGVTFKNGAVFSLLNDNVTVTLEDCTFYACDQSKLTYNGNNSLTNSGAGMCLNLEKSSHSGANFVVKDCNFIGENDNTLSAGGNKYNADGSVATSNKKRGHAIALDAICGGGTGTLNSLLIDGCTINGVRGNAIQLYGTTGDITIKNTKINSWAVNNTGVGFAVRGDYAAGGSRTLTMTNVYFGLDQANPSTEFGHVYVGEFSGNTTAVTETAGIYSK